MNRQALVQRLNFLLSILKTEIAQETDASLSDIKNVLCEDILLHPLRVAYELPNLRSLNRAEKRNFPAIDLADDPLRIAIQLTASTGIEKIRKTVEDFIKHGLNERYDRLLILMLADKKKYRTDLSALAEGKFQFGSNDVVDHGDLFTALSGAPTEDLRTIVAGLEGDLIGDSFLKRLREQQTPSELLHTNLLPVAIPDQLYTAALTLDKKQIRALPNHRKLRSDRDYALALLDHYSHGFPRHFVCRGDLIVTFQPLESADLGRIGLIDEGTIEPIAPDEYYGASLDLEINFRHLLRVCLQQRLAKLRVLWQHEEHMFIFCRLREGETREERWKDQVSSTREVYKLLEEKEPGSKPVHKHFAFRVEFKLVEGSWYLVSEPKWFFSWDGYKRSYAHSSLASSTARMEHNAQIYHHTRFLSWFLTTNLGDAPHTIRLGKNIVVDGATPISDAEWTMSNHEPD